MRFAMNVAVVMIAWLVLLLTFLQQRYDAADGPARAGRF